MAVVQLRPGLDVDLDEVREDAARHIARYKLPKAILVVDEIVRSPAGKADYRWAAAVAREDAGVAESS